MLTDRLGKYRIIAKLGQGGMAAVYLSVVPGPAGFNKLLVVKVLKEDLAQDSDFLAMFLNEARLAARLNHANVVHTYEIGVEDGLHFLAMDYLEGQPLHVVLRRATRARMPVDIHVRILSDVLAGLHYAHTLRDFDGTPLHVVHRDVSPQNVFVTYDGQVKLVDFGVAKAAGAATTTRSGVFKGKLAYVAPEQADGQPADARADIFSVGVMLWEAMSGRRFAEGDSQAAILAARLSGAEPRIRDVLPNADPELANICDRAMAYAPADRYQTAQELRDALESFLDRFNRRVSSQEVAEFMDGLFVQERDKLRRIIDEQLKRILRETSQALPVPTLDVHPGAADPTPLNTAVASPQGARKAAQIGESSPPSNPGYSSPSNGTLVATHFTQGPAPNRSATWAILIGLAIVAVASVAGILVILLRGQPPPAAANAASPRDPAASAAVSAAPERIKITIAYGPAGATAKLDGEPLSASPFVAQVPRDGSVHRIEVEAPGLEPKTTIVSYDRDILVTIELAATTSEPSASASVSASASAEPKRIPTSTLPRPAKSSVEIDETDPYKKK